MGFIADDRYDVFLSYANADNIVHNHWVGDFEKYLTTTVAAEIQRQDTSFQDITGKLSVLRDKTGFPKGGSLQDTVLEKVSQSQFLFIFLGSGYLVSDWCLSELDKFRECAGGELPEALKRLYLIVLDREALERLREGAKPATLPSKRERLWTGLQQVTQQVIRMEDFLITSGTGGLLPVYQSEDHAHPDFHRLCGPLVRELAQKLIASRRAITCPPSVPAKCHSNAAILLGPVPARLSAERAGLADALGKAGAASEMLELDDLNPRNSESLCEKLRSARVLVCPYDPYAVELVRSNEPGGHLALLKSLFEGARKGAAGAEGLLWWKPPATPEGNPPPLDEYDKSFIDSLDKLPKGQVRHGDIQALVAELAPPPPPKQAARVWIEWPEIDAETVEQAKDLVMEHFDAHCRTQELHGRHMNAALKFGDADWTMLQNQLKAKPDGVVIVYNENKDLAALSEQEQAISNMEEVLVKKMFPGLFYLRKTGMFRPTDDWSVVKFKHEGDALNYDPDQLKDFVSHLYELLYMKYQSRRV